ncbi:MAG: hypothetical protein IT438_04635 [Phycisphaerales bacterium]|nr:hypothetical protein [Phycisphaerales bacterium]
MLYIFVVGLLKLLHPDRFFVALASWKSIPSVTTPYIVAIVPLAELAVSLAWIFGIQRTACQLVALVSISVFSLSYLDHLARYGIPHCGCTGVEITWLESPLFVVTRNSVLVILLFASLCGAGSRLSKPSR